MIQSTNSSVLVDFKKQSQYETVYKVEETICDILDSAIQDIKGWNRCLSGKELPPYVAPVEPAGLLKIVSTASLPPAQAPNPVFTDADVTEPPLPPVTAKAAASTLRTPSTNAQAPSGQTRLTLSLLLSVFAMVLASLLLL